MLERLFARGWRRQDSVLAITLTLFGALVINEANKLPPPFFDPLGSAAVPRLVAGLLIGLAFLLILRCLAAPIDHDGTPSVDTFSRTPWIALGATILPALYVAALQFRFLGFAPASTLFVLVLGGLLGQWRPKLMAALVPVAILSGYGLNALLTQFFYIDLPQRSFWSEPN